MILYDSVRTCLFLAIVLCTSFARPVVADPSRPNIVVIYADDLGYGDVTCYNPNGKLPTPHIDKLAAQGMRFTDGHSSSGVCTPSRYTLLTGRYHWRTRLQRGIVALWERPLIDADRRTVAGMLQDRGYTTACIGKWHLGWDWPRQRDRKGIDFTKPIKGGPTAVGFDSYFGTDVPNWPPFCFIEDDRTIGIPNSRLPASQMREHWASKQGPAVENWDLRNVLPTLTDRAVAFITESAKSDDPYFLYMPLTSPHTPLAVNDPWKGKSGLGGYGDLVLETDAMVGRVLEAIEASGEVDNTLVLFTSDNGCAPYIDVGKLEEQGHYPSGPLRGYKSDVFEGGHRVAFIVRWPGVVEPGTVNHQLVHQADLMATYAAIVGYDLADDEGEDSVSFLPLLRGSEETVRETAISQGGNGLMSIRSGDWKLIFGIGSGGWTKDIAETPGQLYHLADDIGETKNLYAERPQTVSELTAIMQQQIRNGRSTPGERQENDVPVRWNRIQQ
ncbi:MAG: arylsulfatase [Pirellulales bacterium]